MSIPWGDIIAGGASIGGSLLGASGASSANRANRDMMFAQLQWADAMRRSYHQDNVWSLKKAGLNPVLSAQYGGNSTPIGGSGNAMINEWQGMGERATALGHLIADRKKIGSEVQINKQLEKKVEAEAKIAKNTAKINKMETDYLLKYPFMRKFKLISDNLYQGLPQDIVRGLGGYGLIKSAKSLMNRSKQKQAEVWGKGEPPTKQHKLKRKGNVE